MLTITDINGNTEGLTGYKTLKRYRNVSGEKSLAFFVMPTSQNAHSFEMVTEESVVEFDGEPYRIKQMTEKPRGATYVKEVVAIHTLFDLIDDHKYELHNGSLTFDAALTFVLGGTGYTYDVLDTFYAQDFENFGDDNRLSMLQTVLKRYGAEFSLNGTHLTFRKRIGNATDFQFRYNYNVKTLARDVKTNNLSTYIKGYGKGVESEYTSPNASVFGIRHAKPVRDERYTTLEGLNERLVAELQDTPEISIMVDFADMRRAGFPYDVPNEGDDVFLIYEPMSIDIEARVMDITELFTETSDLPIKTEVTIANLRNSIVDRMANTEKQVRDMIGSDGKVKFGILDAAVQRATEALQSAQTELEFNNGIIAREKTDPNRLVLLNSAGLGISTDGGNTMPYAITPDGIVADLITVGSMRFDRLSGGTIRLGEIEGDGDMRIWSDPNGNGVPDMVGAIDEYGAYFPWLQATHLRGDVENVWTDGPTHYYVDTFYGNDSGNGLSWESAKKSVQALINNIPRNLHGSWIQINVRGDIVGGIKLNGFHNGDLMIVANTIEGTRRPRIYGVSKFSRLSRGKFLVQDFDMHGDESTVGEAVFVADYCDYIQFYNVKVFGNDHANHAFWFKNSRFNLGECHVYSISDRGVFADSLSQGTLINCYGSSPVGILVDRGSVITGAGTRWAGSIVRFNNAMVGATDSAGTGWNNDVWTVDYGEAAQPLPPAPPEASEKTLIVSASTGDNWGDMYGWSNDDVRQGNYGYGTRWGVWYFDLSALRGKTIVSASFTLYRGSGGASAARTVYFRTHPYTSRAGRSSGQPAMSAVGATTTMAVGETKTVDITSMIQNNIANFTDNSIGVHTTGSTDYMSFGTTPTLTVRYK